jgi:hypothetical protein
MNSYILLCFIALVATIQTIPTIDESTNNNGDENRNILVNNDLQDNSRHHQGKVLRHLKHIIDGTIHRIKAAGVTYRQRLRDDQCIVEYDGQYLTENSVLQIRKKLYRVENCLLERVFHACGPNLLLMLNVVCRVVEQHQTTTTTPVPIIRRSTITPSTAEYFHRFYARANKTPRVITESCCENLCTISELSRYCHR